jgi:hypothetical protein
MVKRGAQIREKGRVIVRMMNVERETAKAATTATPCN